MGTVWEMLVWEGVSKICALVACAADMMTALMVLCACRHKSEEGDMVECAKLLVAKGARVNSQDRYCMSALMYACQRGRDKLVSYLVSAGADVNKQDCRGWTVSDGERGRGLVGRCSFHLVGRCSFHLMGG